jgi:hypothetical protein
LTQRSFSGKTICNHTSNKYRSKKERRYSNNIFRPQKLAKNTGFNKKTFIVYAFSLFFIFLFYFQRPENPFVEASSNAGHGVVGLLDILASGDPLRPHLQTTQNQLIQEEEKIKLRERKKRK